jgi:transposase
VVAYVAQRTDKAPITRLLRCSWEAVAAITVRVVAGHLDDARLEGLDRIGIDEVSSRKGHCYLTVVADHDRDGAVVGAGEGMSSATLERFFDTLGPVRTARLVAASMDLHGADAKVTRAAPHNRPGCAATPSTSSSSPTPPWTRSAGRLEHHPPRRRRHQPGPLARVRQDPAAQLVKYTRWAAQRPGELDRPAASDDHQLRRARHVLFSGWLLKEGLRDLYRLPPGRRPNAPPGRLAGPRQPLSLPAMLDLSRSIRRTATRS